MKGSKEHFRQREQHKVEKSLKLALGLGWIIVKEGVHGIRCSDTGRSQIM